MPPNVEQVTLFLLLDFKQCTSGERSPRMWRWSQAETQWWVRGSQIFCMPTAGKTWFRLRRRLWSWRQATTTTSPSLTPSVGWGWRTGWSSLSTNTLSASPIPPLPLSVCLFRWGDKTCGKWDFPFQICPFPQFDLQVRAMPTVIRLKTLWTFVKFWLRFGILSKLWSGVWGCHQQWTWRRTDR